MHGLPVGAISAALPQPDLGLLQGAISGGHELAGLAGSGGFFSIVVVHHDEGVPSNSSAIEPSVNTTQLATFHAAIDFSHNAAE